MLRPEDLELTRALERCEVPAAGFPHASHLRVAWIYLNESPSVDAAIARMASTLRAFVTAVGKPDKYSDATTAFWMLQIASVRALMPGVDIDDVLRAFPHLLDKDFITAAHAVANLSPAAVPIRATRGRRTPGRARGR